MMNTIQINSLINPFIIMHLLKCFGKFVSGNDSACDNLHGEIMKLKTSTERFLLKSDDL